MKTNLEQKSSRAVALNVIGSVGLLAVTFHVQTALATDRLFTYSYEPETMPAGAMEFEQWVTLRTQRTKKIGRQNYNRWELREEFEYGVTDNYTASLYLNTQSESFRDAAGENQSEFSFKGISLENKFLVLNPAEHAVGLSLYLEPTFAGDEAEVEEKIIIGQRHGNWKWAVNFTHETEWEDNFHETEGVLEGSLGVARLFGKRWAAGIELRSHNVFPDYSEWESTALYLGPVVSYRYEKWWAALTITPQVWGRNYDGGGDGERNMDLVHHERVNLRLIFGVNF